MTQYGNDMIKYGHKPWCAAVIAENAELPWRVKCDCIPNEDPSGQRRIPMKPMPLFDDVAPFASALSDLTKDRT